MAGSVRGYLIWKIQTEKFLSFNWRDAPTKEVIINRLLTILNDLALRLRGENMLWKYFSAYTDFMLNLYTIPNTLTVFSLDFRQLFVPAKYINLPESKMIPFCQHE